MSPAPLTCGVVALTTAAAIVSIGVSPAQAADPADVRVDMATRSIALVAGGKEATVSFTVTNQGPGAITPTAVFTIPFAAQGVTAASANGQCNLVGTDVICAMDALAAGEGKEISIQVAPPAAGTVAAATSGSGQVVVTATPADSVPDPDPANNKTEVAATLDPAPKPVSEVSGTVTDTEGRAVPEAQVTIEDEAGTQAVVASDAAGLFVYSSAGNPTPLIVGELRFTAEKTGYPKRVTSKAKAGQMPLAGVELVLTAAPATPSSEATATPTQRAKTVTSSDTGLRPWHVVAFGTAMLIVAMALLAIILAFRSRAERRRERTGHRS